MDYYFVFIKDTYSIGEIQTDGFFLGGLSGLDPTIHDPQATQAPVDPDTQIMV